MIGSTNLVCGTRIDYDSETRLPFGQEAFFSQGRVFCTTRTSRRVCLCSCMQLELLVHDQQQQ